MPHVVGRTFDTDFIWLDLLLTSIWIIILIRRGYIRHLKFGIFGFIAVFIVDFGIWYSLLGTRVFIELPNYLNAFTFLLYFSFTYGMLMFSFAPLMFDKIIEVKEKFLWTLFLFTGWTLISFASQWIHLFDHPISIYRAMNEQRIFQIIAVIFEYTLLVFIMYMSKKRPDSELFSRFSGLTYLYIIYIFIIGVLIHFAMEFSLTISGIRPASIEVIIFNSLLEFNTGTPILYIMWIGLKENRIFRQKKVSI